MVEVVNFPKPCPRCKEPSILIRKLSGAWWYECYEHGRLYFEFQKARQGVGRWRYRQKRK